VANLVDNAVRFSPAGRPARVEAAQVGDRIHLRVVDNGPGIGAEDRERLFEPFQRLGDRPRRTGVGLGLAVAKGLTEAVGGTIGVEDTPGGGCTMVITLPIATP
jgi:two-component system sensor histidine kinase KdpD